MSHQTCWINQKGAGTGKTWTCVGLLEAMPQFTTFIYLSKMNTAKAVIKGEFISQYGEHNVRFDEDVALIFSKKVIVSTIDSMIYAFSNREIRKYSRGNYYSELVHNFDVSRPRFEEKEGVWNNVKLDRDTLVVIDECQDLEAGYIDCFMSSLATKGVSFYLMGDILQSVVEQNNMFCYLQEKKHLVPGKFPDGMVFKNVDNNNDKIIRFHSKEFVNFVNKAVDFETFGSNKIAQCCTDSETCGFRHDNKPMFLKENFGNTKELFSLLEEIVSINNYEPKDLLFISPIIDSWFMYQLEDDINEFWADYYDDICCYSGKYSILQTSKYGKIDIEISNGKTRILSVHAAKGMGATFVIVVNLLDKSLLSHQTKNGDLKYESMVHVALTRQKENLLIYYNGANTNEDILAKDILDVSNALPISPQQKRCVIQAETLYDSLRETQGGLELINEFEDINFIRSRMGRIGAVEFPYRFLEPIDVKLRLMVNTMVKVLSKFQDDTEFKYMKPCLKRLAILEKVEVTNAKSAQNAEKFKVGDRCLELDENVLNQTLLEIIKSIKGKLSDWKKFRETREGEPPKELCFLESYILLYLLHKISPFTVIQVGNIYHRMARSANQGCRSEYHTPGMCSCLDHLDIVIKREKEEDYEEEQMEILHFGEYEEQGELGDLGGENLGDFEDHENLEEPAEPEEPESPGNPNDSPREYIGIEDILPLGNSPPDGFGATMLSQFEDTMDYKSNFSINLGMSDFYSTKEDVCVVLTVPYVNYVNFMEEITLPILIHSYLIFKANSKLQTAPFSLMMKQFFGMKKDMGVIEKITFYINRLDNDDRRIIVIHKDEKFFSRVNDIIVPVVKRIFGNFIKSWVRYYIDIRRNIKRYNTEEINEIKRVNRITGDILEEVKDVPSEIVGRILDAIDNRNFQKVLENTIESIIRGFESDKYKVVP